MPRWTQEEYERWRQARGEASPGPSVADGEPAGDPSRRPPQQREHQHQVALVKLCRYKEAEYPELALLYAIPNGGARHGAVAARMKAEGVQAGVPDLHLPVPRCGYASLYIELKAPADAARGKRAGRVRPKQQGWLDDLNEAGHLATVCHGESHAWGVIEAYLTEALDERGDLYPPLDLDPSTELVQGQHPAVEAWLYRKVLATGCSVTAAAELLGVSRSTVYDRIERYDIDL